MIERTAFLFLLIPVWLAAGCKSAMTSSTVPVLQAYVPISEVACRDSVGIDGKWRLINIHRDERNFAPATPETLVISDCSTVQYFVNGQYTKKETFKLYRVLDYCADYQLNYISKNDSISCINMRRDTLIFGDCSTFESTRYFYKKIQ